MALLAPFWLPAIWVLLEWAAGPAAAYAAATDALVWQRLASTLAHAASSLGIAFVLGVLLAWVLARSDLPGRTLLLALIPLPLLLAPLVHVLSWFGWLGWNGSTAIVAVHALACTPLVALLSARALRQIGQAHVEQRLLLAGPWAAVRDEWRQALPAAAVGCALGLVFILSDFAVADFLTAVGPKVVVYGDSLYVYYMRGDGAGLAGAALPSILVSAACLAAALSWRRRLGVAVGSRFAAPIPFTLGRWRWPALLFVLLFVGAGCLLPFLSLAWQTGSIDVLANQFIAKRESMRFSLLVGAAAALGATLLGVVVAFLATGLKRRAWIDAFVFLPLALPAMLYGIGLIAVWNRPAFDAIYLGPGVAILALMGRYLAFAYLPLGGALERVSPGMVETAQWLGASRFARARVVWMPLLMPTMAASFCLLFCFTMRELDVMIMLRAGQGGLPFQLFSNIVFARQAETAALALLLAATTLVPFVGWALFARSRARQLG